MKNEIENILKKAEIKYISGIPNKKGYIIRIKLSMIDFLPYKIMQDLDNFMNKKNYYFLGISTLQPYIIELHFFKRNV